ncbi:hypothetical protein LINPERHAP1_LOCUS1638, partial [Linum perenne]
YLLLFHFSHLLSNTKSRTHKIEPLPPYLTRPSPLHHRKVDSLPWLPPSASAPRLQPPSKKSTIATVQVVGSAFVSPDACRVVVPPPTAAVVTCKRNKVG